MSWTRSLALVALLAKPSLCVPSGYSLLWKDEFNGAAVNLSNWRYDLGQGCDTPVNCGWGNAEMEYYTEENAVVANGQLTITAKHESRDSAFFTSSKLVTAGHADFLYGYIEAKIQIPNNLAMWPAFWLLPTNSPYGQWASSGEMDVMERSGKSKGIIVGTLHFGAAWPNNTFINCVPSFTAAQAAVPHVFGMEWTPDYVRWTMDGTQTCERLRGSWFSAAAKSNPSAPYDKRFFVVLNLAIGGYFTGYTWPDPAILTDWAGTSPKMVVDYVRYYAKTGSGAITLPTSFAVPGTVPAGSGYVDVMRRTTSGYYLSGPIRNGSSTDLIHLVGMTSTTYSLNVAQTGTYAVTYTLGREAVPVGGANCFWADAPFVRMFLVRGTDCNGWRQAKFATSLSFSPAEMSAYKDFTAAGPIKFAATGRQLVTLCFEQAPFVRVKQFKLVKNSASMPAYPLQVPGTIRGADFQFNNFKDVYKGPCGPRLATDLAELGSGESYVYDVDAQATGNFAVTYSIAIAAPDTVALSVYLVKGTDCAGTRYGNLQKSIATDNVRGHHDYAATGTLPLTAGRQLLTLCFEAATKSVFFGGIVFVKV